MLQRSIRRVFGLAVAAVVLLATPAAATISIVGVDTDTGEVGVAIASCVSGTALGTTTESSELISLVPGVGAGVSQALLNSAAPPEITRLLTEGNSSQEIIDALIAESFDRNAQDRQHAVVTLDGSAVGFTGSENSDVAIDVQGSGVSVQGNILVSETVANDALAAFEAQQGRLAEKLVDALVAASEAGGDSRCDPQTALFAHVAVAGTDDDPIRPPVLLWVTVNEGSGENPILTLATEFRNGNDQVSVLKGTPTTLERALPFIPVLFFAFVLGALAFIGWSVRKLFGRSKGSDPASS